MKIISRYVLKLFFPIFFLMLCTFVGLFLVIDFFEKVDNLLQNHITITQAYSYFLYKVPFIATQGIPMATLLAALITLGILKRNRELVALRAAGISTRVYVGPIIVAALVLTLVDFGVGETVARTLHLKAQQFWMEKVQHQQTSIWSNQENVWYHGRHTIYQIRFYNHKQQTLEKVSIFYLNKDFQLVKRVDAKQLHWENGHWMAKDGFVLHFQGSTTQQREFTRKQLHLAETPKDFAGLETIPENLDWLSLYNYTKRIRHEGYNAAPYEVELNLRIAFPLTTLTLAILGILIALRQGMHGGFAIAVGVALIIAFLYLTVLQIGCSLATAGILPPLLGVWGSNAIFAALAGYLWLNDAER